MATSPFSGVEVLQPQHDLAGFSCGSPELDEWLRRHALASQQSDGVRVYVVHRANRVVGYYAISSASVERAHVPPRAGRGLGNYAVPAIILARLAVDVSEQGQGLGKALFRDALKKVAAAADIIGVRLLLIHAKDETAKAFYQQFDVDESPTDPLHLLLLLKDVRAILR